MDVQLIAAIVASVVSILGIVLNLWITNITVNRQLETEKVKLQSEEERWRSGFRVELQRDLLRDSSLYVLQKRVEQYPLVWESLKVTAGYNVRKTEDLKQDIQTLADQLTEFAYGSVGLLMSDQSRRFLHALRVDCGTFIRSSVDIEKIRNGAHALKHSMRSDLGIYTPEYESDLASIAKQLGPVDRLHSLSIKQPPGTNG